MKVFQISDLCYPNLINVKSSVLLGLVCYFFDEWSKFKKGIPFTGEIIHIMGHLISSATITCEPGYFFVNIFLYLSEFRYFIIISVT